tara:strand:- start:5261 stop:5914 length:654 start_codon:yes stop_codon:yes gene_type:complete
MSTELFKRILSSIILIPIVILTIIEGSILFNLFLLACFFLSVYEWTKMRKGKSFYYIGIIFVIYSFYTIYLIRDLNNNYIIFFFILSVCVSTDIGGYVFGKIFKGPKLISISPNKTYAGLIGSFILTILSIIFLFEKGSFFNVETNVTYLTYLLAIIISIISQIGDIVISYFKRLSNIKDTGNIIPGHGGLLDRADGIIFAFPFTYLILSTISINFI